MRQLRLLYIAIAAMLLNLGCTTTEKDNLDMSMDSGNAQAGGAAATPPVDKKAETKALALSAYALINWQRHFMPPPTAEQRKLISQKLQAWTDTGNADSLLKKAQAELAIGREPAAEASLRAALRLKPDHAEVLIELAQIYVRRRDHGRAFEFIAQLRDVLERQPRTDQTTKYRYRYVLALAYIGRGDKQKAHDILSDLIGIDPSFAPAYNALASSYISSGRWEAAEFIARRGLDRGKEDASLLNILGAIAAHKNNSLAARDYFNKAIALTPSHAPSLVNRANLSMQLGETQAAELDLQKAIEAAPAYAPAYVAMGVVLRKTGRFKAAVDAFNRAIELDPESSLARYNLGVLYAQNLKQPNTAMRLFHEVLQIQDQAGDIRELARLHIEDLRDHRNKSQDSETTR